MNLSKFVQQAVDNTINRIEKENELGLKDQLANVETERDRLSNQNQHLREDNESARRRTTELDKEIRRMRAEKFQKRNFKDRYDRQLLVYLRNSEGPVGGDALLADLHNDMDDLELLKEINDQLDYMEDLGVVKSTPGGWVWIAAGD